MEKTEIKSESHDESRSGPLREVANDVAMLFSWAKVENAPYRDFSRSAKASPAPPPAAPAVIEVSSLVSNASPPSREPGPAGNPAPAIAIYSVAGGVGKTTVCANLGKTLCSLGEQLLLVDASGRGLLPFYFGATQLRAGLRKFAASDANAALLQVITPEQVTMEWLQGEVKQLMSGSQRTLFDLGPLCGNLLPAVFAMCSVVLVPLLPDLNSVVTVAAIENSLTAPSKPTVFYFFNRFDEQSSNDRQAREFVARQCGQRLLPITLRYDPRAAEALQDGLAAADHTPASELTQDYLALAWWVRRVSPVKPTVVLPSRWSEQ